MIALYSIHRHYSSSQPLLLLRSADFQLNTRCIGQLRDCGRAFTVDSGDNNNADDNTVIERENYSYTFNLDSDNNEDISGLIALEDNGKTFVIDDSDSD